MPVVNTRILRGNTTLFSWKIINIINELLTIQDLFNHITIQYVPQIENESIIKIEAYISKKKDHIGDSVEMECYVADVIGAFGSHITFRIQFDLYDLSQKNAFDILMTSSKTRTLPTFSFSEEPKLNDELKLEIVSYIKSHDAGWTSGSMSSGKKFIKDLAEALWYVDKCGYKTFNDRFTIPADFLQFVNRYDPLRSKKGRPKFTYDELNHHHQNLNAYLKMSWIDHSCFLFLKPSLMKFTSDLINYANYLINQAEQTKKNHESMVPIVNEEDAGKLKIIIPVMFRNPELIKKYKELIDTVKAATYWEEINVDQFYSDNSS